MVLKLYDSLSKKEIAFKKTEEPLRVYACGPTVYHYAHIGNMRKFIVDDVLFKTIALLGYKLNPVMNITDVGHLTSDADEGEDKLSVAAEKENKKVEDIIIYYTNAFLGDAQLLNINLPKQLPRASHYIDQQIELVETLITEHYAYETEEAVYFDVRKFEGYGKISGQTLEERAVGVRDEVIIENNKKHPADFALWFKKVGKHKNAIQYWPSPWGDGFPGWHLECSALAHHFLGHPIDIHTGGVDHLFPHHPNERAQSEGAFGAPFAKDWFHAEHILVDGEKMSKSLGNTYRVIDLIEKGFSPLDYRFLVLGAHYKTRMNFTFEALQGAKQGRKSILHAYWEVIDEEKEDVSAHPLLTAFKEALADNLNSPKALAVVHEATEETGSIRKSLLEEMDSIISILEPLPTIPKEIQELVEKREAARNNKEFMQSDAFREEIETLGWVVDDTPNGPRVTPL